MSIGSEQGCLVLSTCLSRQKAGCGPAKTPSQPTDAFGASQMDAARHTQHHPSKPWQSPYQAATLPARFIQPPLKS